MDSQEKRTLMRPDPLQPTIPGVDIHNAADDLEFGSRVVRQRNPQAERNAFLRLAHLFFGKPEDLLQELVDISIALCGAEAAGISLGEDEEFRWIVTGGRFAPLRNSVIPETAAPCSICLRRNQPQIFSVSQRYYDFLNLSGPVFTNALLIPWHTPEDLGTLWVIPFKNSPGFDSEDLRLLESLADMVALCIRERQQLRTEIEARELALSHLKDEISAPLQDLTKALSIASLEHPESHLENALTELQRLAGVIKQALKVPVLENQTKTT